ncbi:MAG: CHASE3 domain-containing protein [Silvibacterium sp.]|nr:CHASE3 domain-containing protein [Silvibacterium sp.]
MNLRDFNRVLRETLLLPVILLLALAIFAAWQIEHSASALKGIDASDALTAEINELQKLIVDQETGLRGFQLTGDPVMLAPFRAAAQPVNTHFDHLHKLLDARRDLSQRAVELQRLATARDRYQLWLGFAMGVLNKEPAVLNDPRLNQHGKELMDNVRAAIDELLKSETRVRNARSVSALAVERRALTTLIAAALIVGLLLGLFIISRLRKVSRAYDETLEELHRQAEEISERRQWFETTLASIGDAVIACDSEGKVQFMNTVAQELTGWPMQDALGLELVKVFQIVNEETRQPAENPVDKVRRLNSVTGLANHTVLLSRTGSEFVIDDSAAPIRGEDGEMRGVVLVFRDVTETRRTAAALMATEKLAVAGRLAASIAHEIHNPLDAIANLMFLLEGESDRAKRAEYLQTAQQELSRTMQITRTLLSLYREPKAPVSVDLKELAEGVLLLLERRLLQQGIDVERQFKDPVIVEGYPAELRQVFTNVVLNAIDAAGNGGRIRIRIEPVAAQELRGSGVVVQVWDSGPGISDSARAKLFEPFFTTKGQEGTGLGLWVSNGIVQKHGGYIRIANSMDGDLRGACVSFYLPARTKAEPRAAQHVA